MAATETQTEEPNAEQSSAPEKPKKLSDLLVHIVEETADGELSLQEIVEVLDNRCFGPLLLIPALIALSPIGGIPGMSVVTGAIILLIAAQSLVFSSRPWLPQRLLQMSFDKKRLRQFNEQALPWIRSFEKAICARLTFLTEPPIFYVVAINILLLSLLFFPLALLPFAVAIPSSVIVILALGLTAKDGLLILLGFLASTPALAFTYYFWPF